MKRTDIFRGDKSVHVGGGVGVGGGIINFGTGVDWGTTPFPHPLIFDSHRNQDHDHTKIRTMTIQKFIFKLLQLFQCLS